MSQVNVTPVHGSEIESLRHNVAVATESAYGAMRKYAEGLCGVLPAEWYLVEHNDSSDNAKPVHAEKKALFAELKAVNHSNPSTIWARVRKYAQEFMEGAPEQASTGEGESVGKRETRSLELRLVEDLTALWKACGRAESLSNKQADCKTHIGSALIAMGVDLTLIK
jgi:hypothetical protein